MAFRHMAGSRNAQPDLPGRMLAEYRVGPGALDPQRPVCVIVRGREPPGVCRGNDRGSAVREHTLFRKHAYGRLDLCLESGGIGTGRLQHGERQAPVMRMHVCLVIVRAHRARETQLVATRRKRIHARPLEGVLRLEKGRIRRERPLEIEGTEVQHAIDRNVGIERAEDPHRGIHRMDAPLDALQCRLVGEIDLVQQHDIREGDLLPCSVHDIEMLLDVRGVHDGDDRVQHELFAKILVQEESLRNRARIGEAGGLDQHAVETVAPLQELPEDAYQVPTHLAADAAVAGFEDLLFGADHELVVHADLTELVLDDGNPPAMLRSEDAVEERGLPGTQEACEHGDRNASRRGHPVPRFSVR